MECWPGVSSSRHILLLRQLNRTTARSVRPRTELLPMFTFHLLPLPHPTGMSKKMSESLETANLVLTVIFALEMVMKIVGLGFWDYMKDAFNVS